MTVVSTCYCKDIYTFYQAESGALCAEQYGGGHLLYLHTLEEWTTVRFTNIMLNSLWFNMSQNSKNDFVC